MQVDTTEFAALRTDVAMLTELVQRIKIHEAAIRIAYTLGHLEGQEGLPPERPARPSRTAAPRGPRPSHLRLVGDGTGAS